MNQQVLPNSKKQVLGKGMAALLGQLNQDLPVPHKLDDERLQSSGDNKGAARDQGRQPVGTEHQAKIVAMDAKQFQPQNISAQALLGPQAAVFLDIEQITPNTHQPRKVFKDQHLEELAQSIRENGIIQPLIVSLDGDKNKYLLIAGERRLRAAKLVGLKKVPVILKQVNQLEKLMLALIENIQRSDLNCVEEALAYFQLMEEFKLTQEEVAKKVGKERSTVANFLRLLKLPKDAILLLQKEILSFGHAKLLVALKDEGAISKIAQMAAAKNWSVRELEQYLKNPNQVVDSSGEDQKVLAEGEDPAKVLSHSQSELQQKLKEKLDMYRQKVQRKTGFKVDFKTKKSGAKGQVVLKFQTEAELNDILDFLLK